MREPVGLAELPDCNQLAIAHVERQHQAAGTEACTLERYNLFNDALQDYYWQYDNTGLRLLQLRFYDTSTTVP